MFQLSLDTFTRVIFCLNLDNSFYSSNANTVGYRAVMRARADQTAPWWRSTVCEVSRSQPVAYATWATWSGTRRRLRPLDTVRGRANETAAPLPFPPRRCTISSTPLMPPRSQAKPPLPPLPLPRTRFAPSSPDSENPGTTILPFL